MRVHIVGAGPTGLSVAWELAKLKQHQIIVYDRKPGPGGSWWEPTGERRNIHAARAVFRRGWVNTDDMFREMGIQWSDVFEPPKVKSLSEGSLFSALDYCALVYLAIRILMSPDTYKHVSLKDALGTELSAGGQKSLEHLTYQIDGIPWDIMTAYEFIRTIDYTILSKLETQKIPGDQMGRMMQKALEKAGVEFVFGAELSKLVYGNGDTFKAYFSEEPIEDGILVLCLDATPATKLIGDNWGPDAKDILTKGTYESVTVMLYFNSELPQMPSGLIISMNTELKMLAHALSDNKTIAVELLRKPPGNLDPDQLAEEILKQLKGVPGMPKLPQLSDHAIGWGSRWVQGGWTHTQTGHAYSTLGTLPFFGKNKRVAMCGMMSDRGTPYSCMESAVEVGRIFCSQNFGTTKPRKPWTVSKLILVIIILWVALTVKFSGKSVQALTR